MQTTPRVIAKYQRDTGEQVEVWRFGRNVWRTIDGDDKHVVHLPKRSECELIRMAEDQARRWENEDREDFATFTPKGA